MARPPKAPNLLTRNDPRWSAFGKWLKWRREIQHISLKDAAKAIGLSEKQWGRYEAGATSVPRVRIPAIAKVIRLAKGRVLMKAGYEHSDKVMDAENELRWIWKYLQEGDLICAIEIIFELHYLLVCGRRKLRRPKTGNTATQFAKAVVAINEMPGWLCADLIKYLKRRQKAAEDHDYPFTPEEKSKLLKDVEGLLSKPIQVGTLRESVLLNHKFSNKKV